MKEKIENEEMIGEELDKLIPPASDFTEINVDKAWNNVSARIGSEADDIVPLKARRILFTRTDMMKIAAAILILLGLSATAIYLERNDLLSKTVIASTGYDLKNQKVSLPDGSIITLNRNTTLTYHENFGRKSRKVALAGEAFFEISPDASRPFTIDAGKARIKVVGTSFNVITENSDSSVEVFVKTGKVLLSDNSGKRDLMLEPGYVGIMDDNHAEKSVNRNPNYMSWNTGKLEYDGQPLEVVFRDLRRVYNIDVLVDDPSILSNPWTSPIVSQSNDTIIRIICASFNLSYIKDGNVYHLSKK